MFALREDFLARLERWRRVMPSVVENRLELRLLSGPQALHAVVEPASKRCRSTPDAQRSTPIVSSDTAIAIVRFVAGAIADVPLDEINNVPPLLSLICQQLNERRFPRPGADTPERPDIPIEWVRRTGATNTALENKESRTAAEEVLERFYADSFVERPSAVRELVEDKLVSESGFRETVTLDTAVGDLRQKGVTEPRSHLNQLVDQRLLVIEDRGGVPRVELTHDVLAILALRSRRQRRELEEREKADAIATEEKRKKKKKIYTALAYTALALFTVAALSTVLLLGERHRRKEASRLVTQMLLGRAERMLEVGDQSGAFLLFNQALGTASASGSPGGKCRGSKNSCTSRSLAARSWRRAADSLPPMVRAASVSGAWIPESSRRTGI